MHFFRYHLSKILSFSLSSSLSFVSSSSSCHMFTLFPYCALFRLFFISTPPPSLFLLPPLSLSLTHTHTHTHISARANARPYTQSFFWLCLTRLPYFGLNRYMHRFWTCHVGHILSLSLSQSYLPNPSAQAGYDTRSFLCGV